MEGRTFADLMEGRTFRSGHSPDLKVRGSRYPHEGGRFVTITTLPQICVRR